MRGEGGSFDRDCAHKTDPEEKASRHRARSRNENAAQLRTAVDAGGRIFTSRNTACELDAEKRDGAGRTALEDAVSVSAGPRALWFDRRRILVPRGRFVEPQAFRRSARYHRRARNPKPRRSVPLERSIELANRGDG